MRKNIFEIINSKQQPLLEILRIDKLLNKYDGVYVGDEIFALSKGTPMSIKKYVDEYLFKSWKQRGTCIDCSDFENLIGIFPIPNSEDELTNEYIITYCEYAANMVYLLQRNVAEKDSLTDVISAADENIRKFLSWYNYELKYYPKKQKVLAVPNNPYATAVAENIANEELSYSIVEYNHYLLKGKVHKKKDILLALGVDLEPHRKEIASINKKLEDNIFYMLNNLNLRHNNKVKGDRYYNEKVAKMNNAALEKWYDELYHLMLAAYLCMENVDILNEVEKLKKESITP